MDTSFKDLDLPLLLLLLLLPLEELFDDCFFSDTSLNQACIFLLNENAWASISSNHSSSCCLSSSCSSPLHSSCILSSILKRSLNWRSSSSTMTAFRLEKSRSSIVLYFLISLPLIFLLLSFNVCNLYAAPFSVRFLISYSLSHPLQMLWHSVQSNSNRCLFQVSCCSLDYQVCVAQLKKHPKSTQYLVFPGFHSVLL